MGVWCARVAGSPSALLAQLACVLHDGRRGSLPHNGGIAGVAHTPAARTGGGWEGGGRALRPAISK